MEEAIWIFFRAIIHAFCVSLVPVLLKASHDESFEQRKLSPVAVFFFFFMETKKHSTGCESLPRPTNVEHGFSAFTEQK